MTLQEAVRARHSVRSYTDKKIEGDALAQLQQAIAAANKKSGLHIQLCLDAPDAFTGFMARYGKFENVNNYIALVGAKDDKALDEKCGYYGEQLVLLAQQLGLNTCWVGGTYRKGKTTATIHSGEKLRIVVTIGYGAEQGKPHKTKPMERLADIYSTTPAWFKAGVQAAMLAPTALNQQKFHFALLENDQVKATPGSGFYAKVDLGIAKYHFGIGADDAGWTWTG